MGYFIGTFVIAKYIEDLQESVLSSSAIERQCVCVCVCVSNRQDVCRAECCGSISKEPNELEPHSEVNHW
jgi:inosine/xanthosine triphosphate pyrophosphatase family protein